MSEGFERIVRDAQEFFEGIERCRTNSSFSAGDVKDAYNRLSWLRNRYLHERDNNKGLEQHELQAFEKVLENDHFIEGMLKTARQIAEHVTMSGQEAVALFTPTARIDIPVETSSGAFFEGAHLVVHDDDGRTHYVGHLIQLEEAERRIQKAVERASNP